MKFAAIMLCALAISGSLAGNAQAWEHRYRGYGYGESWRSYERGYTGEPRFFRGFHDEVDYRPDYYDLYEDHYVPSRGGLYFDDRGYGVEGRGWQLP